MELYKVFRRAVPSALGPRLIRLCEVRKCNSSEFEGAVRYPFLRLLVGRSFCLCLILLFSAVQLRADVTGSILGYVRDSSGAVLPNATLTVTQTSTGYTRTATTDGSGQYSILALPPGSYRLTASMAGFENGVIDNINLSVNDALKFDFALKVGNVNQSVSVDASTVQVDTASTSMGTTINSSQILAMPLNGRSYLDLLSLQPGVAPTNTNGGYNDRAPASGLYTSSGNVSTDGMPEFANAFLVNGADVNETKNMGAGLIPDADSVQEFRLITNSFSAEYGKFTGSVMNTVTKSGTNSFHGTLFEFYRNQKLDAINYFDSTKAELKRHQYGGVLGGPIWKDRLFTFTDFQQTRQVAGVSTGIVQVLSNDERNGIFSDAILNTPVQGDAWAATLQSRGGGIINGAGGVCQPPACTPTMYNQLGTPVMTTDSNGNSVPGHNISAYIDPVSQLTLPLIPMSNQAGGFNFDDSSHAGSLTDTNMAERIDFVNHKTGDWSFYYHYDDATAVNQIYNQQYFGQINLPGFPVNVPSRNQLFMASNTKTIGATTVNVARLTFFRTAVHTANPSASSAITSYSKYGFNTNPATGGIINTGPTGYPSSVPGLFFNTFTIGNNWLNLYQPDTTYTGRRRGEQDDRQSRDQHWWGVPVLPAGCSKHLRTQRIFQLLPARRRVQMFLITSSALRASFVQCSIQFLDNRTRYGGLYGQDSWKAAPSLTINYGLRWDIARPWSDVYGRLTTPVPGAQSVKFPNSPWATWFREIREFRAPSTQFGGRTLDHVLVSPGRPPAACGARQARPVFVRLTVSTTWAPADNGNFGILGDAPWGLYWASPQQTEFANPYVTRSTGVSQGQHFPFTYPQGPGPFPNFKFGNLLPLYVPGYYNHNKTMGAQHFNFSLQRQLDKSTVLTVAYVGTLGRHVEHGVNILWGSAPLCQSLAGCGPGGEGWRLPAKRPKRLRLPGWG